MGESDRDVVSDPPEPPEPPDPTMRFAVMTVGVVGAAMAVLGLAFFGWRVGLGVALGGAMATANLAVFARLGDAFLSRRGHTAPWALIAAFKLVFLFGGLWMLLKSDLVPGLSIAAGYAALPIGITFGSLFAPRSPDDTGETPGKSGRPGAGHS